MNHCRTSDKKKMFLERFFLSSVPHKTYPSGGLTIHTSAKILSLGSKFLKLVGDSAFQTGSNAPIHRYFVMSSFITQRDSGILC
jgi:hypothetical protein